MIQAVVFDLDGTLYAKWRMHLRLLPYMLKHQKFFHGFARIRSHIRHISPIDNFRIKQASMLASYLGINIEQAEQYIDRLLLERIPQALVDIPHYDGVPELLQWLRAQGIATAVLSDFPLHNKLENLHLADYWDAISCTEDSGYLKPHKKPFHDICDMLHVSPEKVLYVGDNYDYDIRGSHNAGMMSAYFHPMQFFVKRDATINFSCYNFLLQWLEQSLCFA